MKNKIYPQIEHQPIVSFCNSVTPNAQTISSITQLSDGIVFLRILELTHDIDISQYNVRQAADSWQAKLSNLKFLTTKLSQYSNQHCLNSRGMRKIQLLDIAKNESIDQILELFERVFDVIINSENQNYFIQKITSLKEEEQQFFRHKIIRYINSARQLSNPINSPRGLKNHELLGKLAEFQDEVRTLKILNTGLEENNKQLWVELQNYKYQNKKLVEQMQLLESQMADSHEREHISASKSLNYSESLIKQLQDKLTSEHIEFQKKFMRLDEEMSIIQSKYSKASQAEEMLTDSKNKVKELCDKITVLQQEKDDLSDRIKTKEESLKLLSDKMRSLNQDCNKKQFQRISLKAENAKSHARSSELQRMLQMSFEHRKSRPNLSIVSQTLNNMQDPFEAKYEQLKFSLTIANKRIKQLEKQLAKSNVRVEKLQRVEQQKKKLQEILINYTTSRGQQVDILISALYQLRIKYDAVVKKNLMEQSTLGSIQYD